MSVLIKGMEMPTCCYECVFYDDVEAFCYAVRNYVDERLVQKQRDHDCPLIEVKPHGRLIDADELKKGYQDICCGVACEECSLYFGGCKVERMIDDAPTVIGADKDGE